VWKLVNAKPITGANAQANQHEHRLLFAKLGGQATLCWAICIAWKHWMRPMFSNDADRTAQTCYVTWTWAPGKEAGVQTHQTRYIEPHQNRLGSFAAAIRGRSRNITT
jgi:hypothetical protein